MRDETLTHPTRLRALQASELLDSPAEAAFDRATKLASTLIGAPVSLVSLVDGERQFFKSQIGLPEPWATKRETPLSHSFCQYVVKSDATFEVADARRHPLVSDSLAIADLEVISYLGVPIRSPDGDVLGSFCVIDHEPREWTSREHELLSDIAAQVMTEIRLRQAVRDVAALLHQQDEILDIVAHDVRSPAAAISMAAETMERDTDNDRKEHMIAILRRQSARIISLAESLLAGTQLEPAPVDIARVVAQVVEASSMAEDRVVTDSVESLVVSVPVMAVEQILTNVIDNAHRHTEGPVRVGAATHDDLLVLVVADDGPGVEDPERLFTRGRRGDTSASGYGLGMYIVRLLVDRLGGDVTIDSGPDRGTTVIITIPLDAAVRQPNQPSSVSVS